MRERAEILRDAKRLYDYLAVPPQTMEHADILLVAGSHDLRVPEHAARLHARGAAPLVVVSGGYGKMTDGLFTEPEGAVFARVLREHGVPQSAIVIESQAKNTGDNVTFSRKLLHEQGVYPKTGILVCKPYMAKRAWATAAKQWPEVEWGVSAPPIPFEQYAENETLDSEIQLMAGDLQRLRVYADQGYQAPVDVPEDIWAAYGRLVRDGYTQYVIGEGRQR